MHATGFGGELRVGYQRSALLGHWSLDPARSLPVSQFVIEAQVQRVLDTFWITQDPTGVMVTLGRSRWEWVGVRVISLTESAVTMKVTGRPQIVKE